MALCGSMLALGLSACGAAAPHRAGAAARPGSRASRYRVELAAASFPAFQRLAQNSELVIAIRNSGSRPIPDIAVTLVDPGYGTAAQPLGRLLAPPPPGGPILASRSRPVWVINRAPGPCGYSCRHGGPGGAATSDPNTWALGRLAPGATARFAWHVTAMRAGRYTVEYRLAGALAGRGAVAVGSDGRQLVGSFRVTISSRAERPHVTGSGRVLYSG